MSYQYDYTAEANGHVIGLRRGYEQGHLRKSRAYWVVASAVFLMAVWQLAVGASLMVVLSVLSMCLPFSIHAIRWSYRAWQVRSGTLFVEGAFGRYVRDMLWVRGMQ